MTDTLHVLTEIAMRFAALSLVAIGGINAILPEIHRVVVDLEGWMTSAQFADLFALANLAPGPNAMIVALVGWKVAGVTGAILAVACWATGLGVQDATLRSGIAQVVSMNKRGTAFGTFNGVYGVMWFLGSAIMGLLYAHSRIALVIFGVTAQLIAAVMFFRVRRPLAAAIENV